MSFSNEWYVRVLVDDISRQLLLANALKSKVKTHLAKLVFNFVSSLSKIQKIYTSAHDNFVTASLLLLFK